MSRLISCLSMMLSIKTVVPSGAVIFGFFDEGGEPGFGLVHARGCRWRNEFRRGGGLFGRRRQGGFCRFGIGPANKKFAVNQPAGNDEVEHGGHKVVKEIGFIRIFDDVQIQHLREGL